ncbi:uncharacterized protein PADG_00476 [Paracoccidioides brasiliensis Pb18]|uniref:Uncharacterized protein n=1 Tax=Paracoccidioides brasiliensis (strain Pb18) TaxID=502780 RepID=C1G0T6_PARBD|nr:uncharacterized protein PADG_00476 [Paracoccidioides brasiliensis Pb18]EEH44187.2 hypothetical protein PADG_00476 [Paracoccidioides brasiliensis Pb18]
MYSLMAVSDKDKVLLAPVHRGFSRFTGVEPAIDDRNVRYLTIPYNTPPPLPPSSSPSWQQEARGRHGRVARHIEHAAAKPSQPSVFDAINYDTPYADTVSATTNRPQYLHATICDRLHPTH